MSNKVLVLYESGKQVGRNSEDQSIDFTSVLVGASKLEIKESAGAFDFSAVNITNVGTVDGRDVSADGAVIDANAAHVAGDGSDHADVASNSAHAAGDGSDHADVASNTTHRSSNGSDHSYVGNLQTLSGVAAGAENLGTFSGAIITDSSTIKAALQELETAIEAGTDDQTASEVPYSPSVGGNWTDPDPTEVQTALDDLAARVIINDGHSAGDGSDHADVATNSAHSAGDGSDHQDVADLATLSGVAANSTDLGTFTGSVIPDSQTIKAALQALETQMDTNISAISSNTSHASGDGSDHANVATNTAHVAGDGSDHQDVADLATLSGVAANSTDLGSFTGSTIPDSQTIKQALQALETEVETKMDTAGGTFSGNVSMGANKITSTYVPVNAEDLTNKQYVDSLSAGLDPKESVRVASTDTVANMLAAATYATSPSNGEFTADANGAIGSIDGVALALNDRVLIKDQADKKQNGIYTVSQLGDGSNPFKLTRSADMDGSPANEVSGGNHTYAEQGTANKGAGYVVVGDGELTLNTDELTITQFSGAGQLIGGDGISISTNTIALDHDGEGLAIVSEQLALELDGSSLSKSASGLKIADDGVQAVMLNSDVIGNGMVQESDGSVGLDDSEDLTNDNAGAITARQFVYIKTNGNVDLAKSDVSDIYDQGIGIVEDASISAAASGEIITQAGRKISGFSGLTPGKKLYVDHTTAGAYTQDPSGFDSGDTVIELGKAVSATEIRFAPKTVVELA
jgi:hypothetical protein